MSRSADLAIVACIEAGALERQALLLFESVRAFGGALADCPIYALAPRAGLGIGPETRSRLAALRVEYSHEPLNTECVEYGSANRVLAAARIEATTTHEILVVLDSDTLVLREPEAFVLPPHVDVAVRPADCKGIGTSGPSDPFDAYWRELCRLCGVSYDEVPWIRSYVDDVRCKANYNGGLVAVRRDRGILRRWSEFFLASIRAELRPRAQPVAIRSSTGEVAPAASRLWGSNQAALALAIWSTTRRVVTLDPAYNYPLHLHAALGERRATGFDDLVHVHYHWLFEPEAFADNPITAPDSTLATGRVSWLRARTPFRVETSPVRPAARRGLVVLGMHRSGTSALTRTLNLLGAQLPSRLLEPGLGNERGHWESAELLAINDRILESAGTSWRGVAPIPASWFGSAAAQAFQEEILAVLRRDFSGAPLFVIKDPRICRLLPLWSSALDSFGVEMAYLITFRNPIEVAASLEARDGLRPAWSLLMWLRHVIDAERGSRGRPRILVSYDALLDDWRAVIRRVNQELRLGWSPPSDEAAAAAEAFLDRRLRHQRATVDQLRQRSEIPEWAVTLYEALVAAEAGPSGELGQAVDRVVEQLDLADRAFGPVLAEFEQREAEGAARERELERDLARVQARNTRLETDLERTLGSASWRLTEPLRKALIGSPRGARRLWSALRRSR